MRPVRDGHGTSRFSWLTQHDAGLYTEKTVPQPAAAQTRPRPKTLTRSRLPRPLSGTASRLRRARRATRSGADRPPEARVFVAQSPSESESAVPCHGAVPSKYVRDGIVRRRSIRTPCLSAAWMMLWCLRTDEGVNRLQVQRRLIYLAGRRELPPPSGESPSTEDQH